MTDEFTEIVTVGEVKSNVIGVKSFSQVSKFLLENIENNSEVTCDSDEVIAPVKFCFSRLASTVSIEISIDSKVKISDSLPTLPLLLPLRRGGL
jgi:hypothetical protein